MTAQSINVPGAQIPYGGLLQSGQLPWWAVLGNLGTGILASNQPGANWSQVLGGGLLQANQLGRQSMQDMRAARGDQLNEQQFELLKRKTEADMAEQQRQAAARNALAKSLGGSQQSVPGISGAQVSQPGAIDAATSLIDPAEMSTIKALATIDPEKASERLLMAIQNSPQRKAAEAQSMIPIEVEKQNALMPGKLQIATAGRNTMTMNMPPQEKEENKAVGKAMGELFVDLTKAERDASGKIGKMDMIANLAKQTETGKWRPAFLQAKKGLKTLGIDLEGLGITDDTAPADALQAISRTMALELRNPSGGAGMPGALSDKDREFLESATPGLSTDPGALPLLTTYYKKLAQRDKDVGKIAREYRKKHGTLDGGFNDEVAAFAEAHPLFEGMDSGTFRTPGVSGAQTTSKPRYQEWAVE